MSHVVRDLVAASRRFRQRPGFFLGAGALLSLAVGGTTAVFAVVNAVTLRPLPLDDERALVAVHLVRPGAPRYPVSLPLFLDLRSSSTAMSGLAAYFQWSANLTGDGDAERLQAMRVTGNYFEVLGAAVASGRRLTPADAAPDAAPVVLISDGLWKRRFGASASALGQSVRLNGDPYTVVGVLRPDFPFQVRDAEVIAPWTAETDPRRANPSLSFLRVVGRLAPGADIGLAQEDLDARLRAFRAAYPQAGSVDQQGHIVALRTDVIGSSDRMLATLTAAIGLVLLIAVANLANLLLVSGTGRLREFAARRALGASRSRLVTQFLTETLVIAAAGTLLGLIVARLAVAALLAASGNAIPRATEVAVDWVAAAFAIAVGLTIALLAALLPAMQLSRVQGNGAGAQRGVTRGGRVLRRWFVCAEVALAVVLVIGSGLLLRSFAAVQRVDPGFEAEGVLSLRLSLPRARYKDTASLAAFHDALAARVRAVPGVSGVAASNVVPMNGYLATSTIRPPGLEAQAANTLPEAHYRMISPDYLSVMGIPLLSGRAFTAFDNAEGMPVVLISRGLARRYWPDGNAIGSRMQVRDDGDRFRTVTIVGIAGDVRHFGPEVDSPSEVYVPIPQVANATSVFLANNMYWVVKTGGNPLALAGGIRAEIARVDRDVAASFVRSMEQWMAQSVHPRRFNVRVLMAFALTALLLAGAGVYGVAAETVALRTRELGVRAALGATDSQLKTAVVKGGLGPVAAGVAAGTGAAFGMTRWLASSLYGVERHDAVTYIGVAALISTIGLLALYIPARRVARIDPVLALRAE